MCTGKIKFVHACHLHFINVVWNTYVNSICTIHVKVDTSGEATRHALESEDATLGAVVDGCTQQHGRREARLFRPGRHEGPTSSETYEASEARFPMLHLWLEVSPFGEIIRLPC